jgi:outer membrane murein-binding lipoprotein Lpp
MVIWAMQIVLTNSWSSRYTLLAHTMRTVWHRLPRIMVPVIAPLILAGCVELVEFRSDIARLRSDLQANAQILSQLSARVDELERRQAATESASRQTQYELSQAIEVLLKRSLIAENRRAIGESGKSQSKEAEKPKREALQLPFETQRAISQGRKSSQEEKHLSLGMTQEEVRRMLGEPVNIEEAGSYIFWQYSPMKNQKYVVFERVNGQVSGWRGL